MLFGLTTDTPTIGQLGCRSTMLATQIRDQTAQLSSIRVFDPTSCKKGNVVGDGMNVQLGN